MIFVVDPESKKMMVNDQLDFFNLSVHPMKPNTGGTWPAHGVTAPKLTSWSYQLCGDSLDWFGWGPTSYRKMMKNAQIHEINQPILSGLKLILHCTYMVVCWKMDLISFLTYDVNKIKLIKGGSHLVPLPTLSFARTKIHRTLRCFKRCDSHGISPLAASLGDHCRGESNPTRYWIISPDPLRTRQR